MSILRICWRVHFASMESFCLLDVPLDCTERHESGSRYANVCVMIICTV